MRIDDNFVCDKVTRILDTALRVDGTSASHSYTIRSSVSRGFLDIIFNLPTNFPLDKNLNDEILRIIVGALYPYLTVFSNNGPSFVATGIEDFSNARAMRFYFKIGQYSRLHFDSLDDCKMIGSKFSLMNGYDYDLYSGAGHVALSGASGQGKSQLLCYFLACVNNSVPNAIIKIIDPKLDYTLYNFAKTRNIDYYSPSGNMNDYFTDVINVLSSAIDEIHERQKLILERGVNDLPPFIIALDEATALSASINDNKRVKELQSLITQICLMGRSARVFLWISSQSFDASSGALNSTSRDQMGLKIVLSSNPGASDCRYLFKEYNPSSLVINHDGFEKGLGIAQIQADNRIVPFMAPYIGGV